MHRTTVGKWVTGEHRVPYAVDELVKYLLNGGIPPAANGPR